MDSNARATNRRWGPSDTWDEGPEEKKRKQSWRSLSDLVGGGDDAALQAGGPSSEKGGAGRSQDAEERAGTSAGGGKRNGTVGQSSQADLSETGGTCRKRLKPSSNALKDKSRVEGPLKRPPQADRAWPSADVATYDRTGGVATPDVSKKGGTHSSREGAGSLTEGQWAQLVEELPSKPFATLAGRFVHTFYTKLDNPADERILKYGTHFTKFIQELNEYQAQWQAGGRSLTYNLGTRVVQERACEFAEPAKGMYQMELMWLSRDFLKELLSVKKYYYSTKKHSKRPLGTYIGLERRVL